MPLEVFCGSSATGAFFAAMNLYHALCSICILQVLAYGNPVKPAALPKSLMWRITLVEHHDDVQPGAVDFSFGNYYFDWNGPLVASRQENAVGYAAWRLNATKADIPWNTFWAYRGKVAAAIVDLSSDTVGCRLLPLPYNSSFWP